jgi:hypothetical protein
MNGSNEFRLDVNALSPEMKSLVDQVGQGEIAGDYFNPHGVPVDPLFVISSVDTGRDAATSYPERVQLKREAFSTERFARDKREVESVPEPPGTISPRLREAMNAARLGASIEAIITFPEDMRIPLLPEFAPDEDRGQRVREINTIVTELQEQRVRAQSSQLRRLKLPGPVEVLENFWLTNSVAVRVPVAAIEILARLPEVLYIQPVLGGEEPPQDANANNDAIVARGHIVSDPYFDLGLTSPWIGLLDTGVRRTHTMFNGPARIDWCMDCINGGTNCDNTAAAGYDCTDIWPHGTSSAGILSGNANSGNRFRGVSPVLIDSWRIYTSAGLNSTAAIRAIQRAAVVGDRVLVGELQAAESETGAIATAADNAYDAGAIFVSANGNFGPASSTVRSPGIAHKVLGVGAFMTTDQSQYDAQGRGPATDGRWKPDIQAPSFSETTGAGNDTDLSVFGGTSGATPYASAAAMISRNWLRQFGTFDNGQTYAFMILYGQNPWPYDNTIGAGPIRMATNGHAWWGKVAVTNGATVDIPITIASGKKNFDGALWWPETASQQHNDVDLHLIDPGGVERAKGFSAVSIFERARVAGGLAAGTWTLRIRGYSVQTSSQMVYWAAHIEH